MKPDNPLMLNLTTFSLPVFDTYTNTMLIRFKALPITCGEEEHECP